VAQEKGDHDWLKRHEWWLEVGYRLDNDLPSPTLNG
jgi:hypothetical protein